MSPASIAAAHPADVNGSIVACRDYSDEGELIIAVPEDVLTTISEKSARLLEPPAQAPTEENGDADSGRTAKDVGQMIVTVFYEVSDVQAGVHFVNLHPQHHPDRKAHMYTPLQPCSARLWMPCIDTLHDKCTWDISIRAHPSLVAVASGRPLPRSTPGSNSTSSSPDVLESSFRITNPVPAFAIGFAVGPFDSVPCAPPSPSDNSRSLPIQLFFPPSKAALAQTFSCFFPEAAKCVETFLGATLPSPMNVVFVDEPHQPVMAAANLLLIGTDLLHDQQQIEALYKGRWEATYGFSLSLLLSWISLKSWCDWWILVGVASYVTLLYFKRVFGNNEYRMRLYKARKTVLHLDGPSASPLCPNTPPLVISANTASSSSVSDAPRAPMFSPADALSKLVRAKAPVVLHMLEKRLGSQGFTQGLQRVLGIEGEGSGAEGSRPEPRRACISTKQLLKTMKKVTGADLKSFAEHAIYGSGYATLQCAFFFNRKRHTTEFVAKQASLTHRKFAGVVTLRQHETEGTFEHSMLVEDEVQQTDILCHSRLRKQRPVKLTQAKRALKKDKDVMDDGAPSSPPPAVSVVNPPTKNDVPVLWVRVDPDMEWLLQVRLRQPEHMWLKQINNHKDVFSQLVAVQGLEEAGTIAAIRALDQVLANEHLYHGVRSAAAKAMLTMSSSENNWLGLDLVLRHFKSQNFDTETSAVLPNDFSHLPKYFVNKGIIKGLSHVRTRDGSTPTEALDFLLHLLKFNDNSENPFDDGPYVACIMRTLSRCDLQGYPSLPKIRKHALRYLHRDALRPSHHNVLTSAALRLLAVADALSAQPEWPLLYGFFRFGHYSKVRAAAAESYLTLGALWYGTDRAEKSRLAANVAEWIGDNHNAPSSSAAFADPSPQAILDSLFGLVEEAPNVPWLRRHVLERLASVRAPMVARAHAQHGTSHMSCLGILVTHLPEPSTSLSRVSSILTNTCRYDLLLQEAGLALFCSTWSAVHADKIVQLLAPSPSPTPAPSTPPRSPSRTQDASTKKKSGKGKPKPKPEIKSVQGTKITIKSGATTSSGTTSTAAPGTSKSTSGAGPPSSSPTSPAPSDKKRKAQAAAGDPPSAKVPKIRIKLPSDQ